MFSEHEMKRRKGWPASAPQPINVIVVAGQTSASLTTFLGLALALRHYQALAYKSPFTAASGSRPCIVSVMAGELQLPILGSVGPSCTDRVPC